MPEFILDHGDTDAAQRFAKLDSFTQGYIEAMFFTDANDSDDECNGLTVADIAPDAWSAIEADCRAFQDTAASLLDEAYSRDDYSAEQAGRDYWFTRNRHGVGFWDRQQLEPNNEAYEALTYEMILNRDNNAAWGAALAKRNALKAESLGDKLSALCRHRPVDVYKGDDGLLWLS